MRAYGTREIALVGFYGAALGAALASAAVLFIVVWDGRLDNLERQAHPEAYVIKAEDDPVPCKIKQGGIYRVNGVLVAHCVER